MNPVYFLLVDDLKENLLSLEALLRRDGLVLLLARSGDEALELLLKHEVALALIDVQMPGLNGFELAELMRGNERTRRVPIIFVTAGSADNQRRFHGYETGAVDFIQKPVESDVLRSKADVFFELYRQRQQIAAQRDELKIHADALQEADHRKDEFLAVLAHELRNPLAPIRHGLDILRNDSACGEAGKIHDMMDRQLRHLVRLVDDLLDVSRVTQGKIELRREKILVADVVRSALEASTPFIEAAQHSFTTDLTPDPLWIDADLTRVAQIVSNLLNNAAKYTPQGGKIRLSVRRSDGTVAIAVSDSGVGIPKEMQTEIFNLFAQVDNHLDRSQGGLGIGLALVRQLVAMHGGTVIAESVGSGQGSVFTVSLPIIDAPEQTSEKIDISVEHEAADLLKILVVDDNIDVAETIGWMLEAIGHHCRLVHDGHDVLAAAIEYRPDVVLLDIGLPGMDGYAVCRALRENALFKTTPIIAQSGWGRDEDRAAATKAGFNHHLVKPVSLRELENVIAGIVKTSE